MSVSQGMVTCWTSSFSSSSMSWTFLSAAAMASFNLPALLSILTLLGCNNLTMIKNKEDIKDYLIVKKSKIFSCLIALFQLGAWTRAYLALTLRKPILQFFCSFIPGVCFRIQKPSISDSLTLSRMLRLVECTKRKSEGMEEDFSMQSKGNFSAWTHQCIDI